METVCTASYSILINGEPCCLVKPTRGIKQGDPLSPYLFLLCAEGLFAMLQRDEANRSLKGVVSCQHGVNISHLLFTDDSLLFCQATIQECQVLFNILSQYELASRQAINHQKTLLFFNRNTRQDTRDSIKNLLGAKIIMDCKKYLGLLMVGGRTKTTTFREIQARVTKRVLGWKEKFISNADREILIKLIA